MYKISYTPNSFKIQKQSIIVLTTNDWLKFFLQFYLDYFVRDAFKDIQTDFEQNVYNDIKHVKFLTNLFKLIENKQYQQAYDLIYITDAGFQSPTEDDISYEIIDSITFQSIPDPIINPNYYKFIEDYFKVQVFKNV